MPEISAARPEEIARIVELLDDEFMAKRQRSGSVARHYPDVFQATNAHNLLVLRVDNTPVSSCALQPITIHRGQKLYNGALIGFVYTDPAHRGRGLAAQLLTEAEIVLRNRNLDFAALFTTLGGFYEKLGWAREDHGLFGSISNETEIYPLELFASDPSAVDSISWIDAIRQKGETLWVERSAASYRRCPLAVEQIFVLFSTYRDAYALIGMQGQSNFLYEIGGTDSGCEMIWNAIMASSRQLSINCHADSGVLPWLKAKPELQLQPQTHALWKWFAPALSGRTKALNHIPYFDRI